MWRGLYTAASGMVTEMYRTDNVANNLSNANTTGFKRAQVAVKEFAPMLLHRINDKDAKKLLKEHAKHLADIDFDKFWIFIYECLSENELKDEWKKMKEKKVTFLRAIY